MSQSTYYTAWQMSTSIELQMRVAASVQQESEAGSAQIGDPEQWARDRRWEWATQTDWIAAVQAAMDTGITAWGSNPSVVTDQHILSYVQGALAA